MQTFLSIKYEENGHSAFRRCVGAFRFIINSLHYAAELPIVFDSLNIEFHALKAQLELSSVDTSHAKTKITMKWKP